MLSPPEPPCCCKCKPCTRATYTTNASNPVWDLRPYKCAGRGCAGRPWRLIECGAGITYESGSIDENGIMSGLPDEFVSSYSYNGYMALEIGCPDPEQSETGETWPPCGQGPSCECGSCPYHGSGGDWDDPSSWSWDSGGSMPANQVPDANSTVYVSGNMTGTGTAGTVYVQ